MIRFDDTICAPATTPGTGAISVIRISGPEALRIVDSVVHFHGSCASESEGYRIKYGLIPDVDEVLVSIFRAPKSYTGEDSAEINCHASPYIVRRILHLLIASGARMAGPGEFTRRAFVNGKMDLAQAEAVADMISASSEASARLAMNQLKGKYSQELRTLRDQLVELASLMELELDFSEEEVEFAGRDRLRTLLGLTSAQVRRLTESFKLGNAIKQGVPVVIAGAVNSGKSTLLNALLGEDRAIVSDIPGTTRDTVEEELNIDGILFRFIDTAGIRESTDTVEKIGIERSLQSIDKAAVVLAVLDGCASAEDASAALSEIRKRLSPSQTLITLRNKADALTEAPSEYPSCELEISAKTGLGLDALKTRLSDLYKTGSIDEDTTLVTNLRHYEALSRALSDLEAVRTGLDTCIPTDLLAEDLRSAIRELGTIFGEISPDEVLGSIFEKFCIGK